MLPFTNSLIGIHIFESITEADLENYPGMYLFCSNPGIKAELKGVYAPYPKVEKQGGHINSQIA